MVTKEYFLPSREKFSIAFLALRQRIMVKTVTPLSSGKRRVARRNSLRLVIPPPRLQSLKAGVQANESEPDKRRSFFEPTSTQLHDARRRRSSTLTPRLFQLRQLKLEYDRSRLRRPSYSPETPMHLGAQNQEETQAGDSYVPKITVSSHNWHSFLARNYYRLNNFKLLATFIINVMLLTFKVHVPDIQ